MKLVRPITAVAVVFVSSAVFAAPPVPEPPRPVLGRAILVTKATDAEAARARSHVFKPPHVAMVHPEDQTDGPSLLAHLRTNPRPRAAAPSTPKLNVTKFGETVHAAFKDNVRGYALGLRKGGQHILTLIWDWARSPEEGGKGWTLDTRMHTASVGKLMTAIIATKMLDERNLSFDTKIGAYLPNYWTDRASTNAISFRQLLTHNAGFTAHAGDYATFKAQIERDAMPGSAKCADPPMPPCPLGYTNGSFSLVRVLNATMTGAVSKSSKWDLSFTNNASADAAFNDAMWDLKATDAFLDYAQAKVFTPSGVANVKPVPSASGAMAYSQKGDTQGWNSGDVFGQLGGVGFRLSVNDVLDVMGTFRRKGTIVSPLKAKEAIEAKLGLDQILDTPAGKLYNKNGRWGGKNPSEDVEQSVAYYLPEDMECVVLVNSWIGPQQASLRGTINDAYLANLE